MERLELAAFTTRIQEMRRNEKLTFYGPCISHPLQQKSWDDQMDNHNQMKSVDGHEAEDDWRENVTKAE